nr:reverse transcriptase domain-containing protein [Tanacetum cinerariifolium]
MVIRSAGYAYPAFGFKVKPRSPTLLLTFSSIIFRERVDGLVEMVEGVEDLGEIRTLSREVAVSMSRNDFKFIMIEEFCPSHDMQKLETELWNHAMVEAGHATYTDRFHELARLVPHLVTLESRKIKRNGSIKRVEKKGNVGEPSKDKNDNKRGVPRNVNPVSARNLAVRACYECGSTDHVRHSLLLISLCCDDAYPVMPRDSALAGCDRLVSKLELEDELIEEEPLEEPREEG